MAARRARRQAPVPDHTACSDQEGGCEIGELFRLLGKTHMLDVLHLFIVQEPGATLRFVEVQKTLGLSPNTLSERLKELTEAGLLQRTAYNEIPPRVDYQATRKARDLEAVFEALIRWTKAHNLKPETTAPRAAEAAG